jgi:hypothetical protein
MAIPGQVSEMIYVAHEDLKTETFFSLVFLLKKGIQDEKSVF